MKFNIIIIYVIYAILLLVSGNVKGQGCVAIRGVSGCSNGQSNLLLKGEFLTGTNFRYFKSFRHFRGTHEETNRVEEGTEVINDSYFLDFTVNYAFTDRIYATLIVPFVYHERSSMYEHGGNPPNGLGERHTTYSKGLADVRVSASYWLFNPAVIHKSNLAVGLGLKLPTGDYNATSIFYNQGPDKDITREAVVDQSIQPGDGGLGYTVEIQGFHMLSDKLMFSGNLYYLLNPQATNGILTRNGRSEFSVPDQYAIRLGASYLIPERGLGFYIGPRMEAVPSSDLLGSSDGYRRPGYVISVEPGISYGFKNLTASLNIPVALERNRTKSYSDKLNNRHGDAAFADYLINFSLNYKIPRKIKVHDVFEMSGH